MVALLSVLGLAIVCAGWAIQLASSWKGKKQLQNGFLLLYFIGVLILIADGWMGGLPELSFMNAVALLLAGLVLYKNEKKVAK